MVVVGAILVLAVKHRLRGRPDLGRPHRRCGLGRLVEGRGHHLPGGLLHWLTETTQHLASRLGSFPWLDLGFFTTATQMFFSVVFTNIAKKIIIYTNDPEVHYCQRQVHETGLLFLEWLVGWVGGWWIGLLWFCTVLLLLLFYFSLIWVQLLFNWIKISYELCIQMKDTYFAFSQLNVSGHMTLN